MARAGELRPGDDQQLEFIVNYPDVVEVARKLVSHSPERGVERAVLDRLDSCGRIQQGHHVQCDFRVGLMEVAKE